MPMEESGNRIDRAQRYVLGLMDDEERERAEHDLEVDPDFRDAMVEIAQRMHLFDRMAAPDKAPQDAWKVVEDRLASMPQMRPAPPPVEAAPPDPQAPFGRRRSDALRDTIAPAAVPAGTRMAPHSVPNRRALAIALGLIVAFVLGYVAGRASLDMPASVQKFLP
jgi:hypothetical protein